MAKKVRFEELIIGGLLKLGSLDQIDIKILKEWLAENYDIEIENGRFLCNGEYLSHSPLEKGADLWTADKFFLNPNYNFDTDVSSIEGKEYPLSKKLGFAQGPTLSACFDNLDLNTFVLRKIRMLSPLTEDYSLLKNFSARQINIIENLQRNGYLDYAWNDDEVAPYDSFRQLRITKLGEARIFIDNNKSAVDLFFQSLGEANCDYDLLERFISKMNLNGFIVDILNVAAFYSYCFTYDDAPTHDVATDHDDKAVEVIPTKKLTAYRDLPAGFMSEKDGLLQRVLAIPERHTLYATHPNNLFSTKLNLNDEELEIPWESIDPRAMLRFYEPKAYEAKTSQNIAGCIRNLIGSKCSDGKNQYLVVLERYLDRGEDKFIVRGIIKINKNGCGIVLNPEFEGYVLTESSPENEHPTKPVIYKLTP